MKTKYSFQAPLSALSAAVLLAALAIPATAMGDDLLSGATVKSDGPVSGTLDGYYGTIPQSSPPSSNQSNLAWGASFDPHRLVSLLSDDSGTNHLFFTAPKGDVYFQYVSEGSSNPQARNKWEVKDLLGIYRGGSYGDPNINGYFQLLSVGYKHDDNRLMNNSLNGVRFSIVEAHTQYPLAMIGNTPIYIHADADAGGVLDAVDAVNRGQWDINGGVGLSTAIPVLGTTDLSYNINTDGKGWNTSDGQSMVDSHLNLAVTNPLGINPFMKVSGDYEHQENPGQQNNDTVSANLSADVDFDQVFGAPSTVSGTAQ